MIRDYKLEHVPHDPETTVSGDAWTCHTCVTYNGYPRCQAPERHFVMAMDLASPRDFVVVTNCADGPFALVNLPDTPEIPWGARAVERMRQEALKKLAEWLGADATSSEGHDEDCELAAAIAPPAAEPTDTSPTPGLAKASPPGR